MYALKRIAAYVIDMVLVMGPLSALFTVGESWLLHALPASLHVVPLLFIWPISLGFPVLFLGTLTGLTGRSPGKWILFLKVQDYGGDPPGIAQGILREILKAFSLGLMFGSILALRGLVTQGRTFYDEWLDLEVEDLRPSGLTPTQKKFRKYMREQEKQQRKACSQR
jgi:uncharacterized RDD family membrane protein YckC